MITARQSRAARALLGWTQETLADRARVSLTALKRLESDSGLEVYESTRDQVRRALEGSGIVLLNSGQSVGVMPVGDKANPWGLNASTLDHSNLAASRHDTALVGGIIPVNKPSTIVYECPGGFIFTKKN